MPALEPDLVALTLGLPGPPLSSATLTVAVARDRSWPTRRILWRDY